MSDLDDITHAPTPRRRQQARESGQIAHSYDLASVTILLAMLTLLGVAGGALATSLMDLMRGCLGGSGWRLAVESDTPRETVAAGWQALVTLLASQVLPILIGSLGVAVAVHAVQTGFWFRFGRVAPDASRLNPWRGSSRIVSGENVGRLAFALLKLAAILVIAALGLWSRREQFLGLVALPLPELVVVVWQLGLQSCLEVGAGLLALAALDYVYQRVRLERSLQMTPQEMREEMRELNGDPQVASRRRALLHRRVNESASSATAEAPTERGPIAVTRAQVGALEAI